MCIRPNAVWAAENWSMGDPPPPRGSAALLWLKRRSGLHLRMGRRGVGGGWQPTHVADSERNRTHPPKCIRAVELVVLQLFVERGFKKNWSKSHPKDAPTYNDTVHTKFKNCILDDAWSRKK